MMSQDQTRVRVPDYIPSEKQAMFHTTTADEKVYGGAAGGGKTAALAAEAITICLEYPGIPVDCFRRTIPELKSTFYVEIMKMLGAYIDAGHCTYRGQDREFLFTSGSKIRLNYCDNDADVYKYQGREMPIIIVDELTQFPQAWIEYLKTRNRTANESWPVLFLAGTNPGGIGHGYVKQKYIDVCQPNTVYSDPITGITQVFVPAKLTDHVSEAFQKSYGRQLNAISDPNLRAALRDGDWDTFAGQVFTEWSRSLHVCDPFAVPVHWRKWRSMDYGNHNSVLWHTLDPQTGRSYVYREYRLDEYVSIENKSATIIQLENDEDIAFGLADPSIWNGVADEKTGKSVAELFEQYGVKWIPANNDRMAGLAVVHDSFGLMADGLPKTQFFSTCLSSIRTIPSLPYDLHKVEDVDTEADDHDYDSYRYGKMGDKRAGKTESGGKVVKIRGSRPGKQPQVIFDSQGRMAINIDPRRAYAKKRSIR
jgi:hypothetical protein